MKNLNWWKFDWKIQPTNKIKDVEYKLWKVLELYWDYMSEEENKKLQRIFDEYYKISIEWKKDYFFEQWIDLLISDVSWNWKIKLDPEDIIHIVKFEYANLINKRYLWWSFTLTKDRLEEILWQELTEKEVNDMINDMKLEQDELDKCEYLINILLDHDNSVLFTKKKELKYYFYWWKLFELLNNWRLKNDWKVFAEIIKLLFCYRCTTSLWVNNWSNSKTYNLFLYNVFTKDIFDKVIWWTFEEFKNTHIWFWFSNEYNQEIYIDWLYMDNYNPY